MAEEQKTETTQTEEIKSGQVVFNSQEDFDAVISRRIAKEREKFKDYEAVQAELEKVRQKEKERAEKEMSELEKLSKTIEEKDTKIADLITYKEWHDEWERRETEKIEKAMEGLSDDDKELINSVPLEKRLTMVEKLKPSENRPGPQTGKNYFDGKPVPTAQEAMDIRIKYGPSSLEYRQAAELIRKAKGI